jgi:hypothetical protein
MRRAIAASLALGASLASATNYTGAGGLPVVDLGYELHQAAFYNVSPSRVHGARFQLQQQDETSWRKDQHKPGKNNGDTSSVENLEPV